MSLSEVANCMSTAVGLHAIAVGVGKQAAGTHVYAHGSISGCGTTTWPSAQVCGSFQSRLAQQS